MTHRIGCLLLLSFISIAGFAAEPALPPGSTGKPATPKPLSPEQQKALLEKRIGGGMVGRFNSFASLLYATTEIILHTDSEKIGKTPLTSPFPDFYRPTCAELFNSIARQTGSSWSYDAKHAFWRFATPALPMPFKVKLPEGWKSEERNNYLSCQPPGVPVGMDVYILAEYSGPADNTELGSKMREASAMMFAQNFKKDVTSKEMTLEKVGPASLEALYFKTPTPRPGTTWRQWAIAEKGQVILIVSAIDDEKEKEILPGVEEALKTFELMK